MAYDVPFLLYSALVISNPVQSTSVSQKSLSRKQSFPIRTVTSGQTYTQTRDIRRSSSQLRVVRVLLKLEREIGGAFQPYLDRDGFLAKLRLNRDLLIEIGHVVHVAKHRKNFLDTSQQFRFFNCRLAQLIANICQFQAKIDPDLLRS